MKDATELLVCVTTLPDRATAERIAEILVREGLAACVQVGADLASFYVWQGGLCRDPEVAVNLKVVVSRWAACLARLREMHPYDVPQIIAWRADIVGADYLNWAVGEEA